jgi:hypothetical protein
MLIPSHRPLDQGSLCLITPNQSALRPRSQLDHISGPPRLVSEPVPHLRPAPNASGSAKDRCGSHWSTRALRPCRWPMRPSCCSGRSRGSGGTSASSRALCRRGAVLRPVVLRRGRRRGRPLLEPARASPGPRRRQEVADPDPDSPRACPYCPRRRPGSPHHRSAVYGRLNRRRLEAGWLLAAGTNSVDCSPLIRTLWCTRLSERRPCDRARASGRSGC